MLHVLSHCTGWFLPTMPIKLAPLYHPHTWYLLDLWVILAYCNWNFRAKVCKPNGTDAVGYDSTCCCCSHCFKPGQHVSFGHQNQLAVCLVEREHHQPITADTIYTSTAKPHSHLLKRFVRCLRQCTRSERVLLSFWAHCRVMSLFHKESRCQFTYRVIYIEGHWGAPDT